MAVGLDFPFTFAMFTFVLFRHGDYKSIPYLPEIKHQPMCQT